MIDLERWTRSYVGRPLAWAVCGVLALQVGYLAFLGYEDYAEQLRRADRLVETASLGMQQDDRPLVEAALMRGLKDVGAAAVGACRGSAADIVYPSAAGDICSNAAGGLIRWTVRRRAIGIDEDFVFVFDRARVFGSFLIIGAIAALMGAVLTAILLRARRRFEAEVLGPLCDGLNQPDALKIRELEDLRCRNEDYHGLRRKQAVAEAIVALSTQVAHDIRSPLAALEEAAINFAELPREKAALLRDVVARIGEVANELLTKHRASAGLAMDDFGSGPRSPLRSCALAGMVEALVAEKRLKLGAKPEIQLEFHVDTSREIRCRIQAVEFKRLFSNLVDNAVEALPEGRGAVWVSLFSRQDWAFVRVHDTGKGFPREVLSKIGLRGVTSGKPGGSGLGLSHASHCARSWGGRLEVDSEPGKGATVTLALPLAPEEPVEVVLIDDDSLIRRNWELSAPNAGKKLWTFASVAEFLAANTSVPRRAAIYLDSHLADGDVGEAHAERLRELGFQEIYISTGYEPEGFSNMKGLRGVIGKSPPWVDREKALCVN